VRYTDSEEAEFCPVCALQGALSPEKTESLPNISSELYFEHYQVFRNQDGKPLELGHRGMGVTYKAIDTHLGCLVALKITSVQLLGNESARSRFLREAPAAASGRCPYVATVFHPGESGGSVIALIVPCFDQIRSSLDAFDRMMPGWQANWDVPSADQIDP
jgi:hypothetical protein